MKRDLPMNKILIVGHPQSGYQDVEALLRACGMASAQPSRREGFLPEQISETLCKAHGAAPVRELSEGREVRQIQAGPVWHGMALDLMLGNLDQPLWGWSDPQALYLLDYWRDLDPSIHFILVYDRPHSVLTRASAEEAASLTPEALDRLSNAWATYNAALLHFFHRNTGRCLLVQSRQVRASASRYLQQVRARIHAPWAETLERLAGPEAAADDVYDTQVSHDAAAPGLPPLLTADPPLALFIADALTRRQPQSLALYEELQASANLPLADESEVADTSAKAFEAWHAMVAQQGRIVDTRFRLEEQATQFDTERAQIRQSLAQVEDEAARTAQAAKREGDLLLTQLHEVQEELERQYLSGCAQAEHLTRLQNEQQLIQQQREQADQLAQQRQQQLEEVRQRLTAAEHEAAERAQHLQTALEGTKAQATQIDDAARVAQAARQEGELLLAQLHQVQEELERQYLSGKEQSKQLTSLQSEQQLIQQQREQADQLAQQRQQQLQEMRGRLTAAEREAAERTQHLQNFKTELAAAKAQVAAAQAAAADPALADENELLLAQLHSVQEELERYYLETRSLKAEQTKLAPAPAHYGAADRIRQQLTYQVGAKLLERSRTLTGLVGMPWAVMGVIRQHRRKQNSGHAQNLPPIHTYRDAHEAERMQNHLSYRLGHAFLRNATPVGWLRMPFALRREVRQFRERRGA